MDKIVFVLGGCRSGKSRHALETVEKIGGDKKVFIATCLPDDDEMKQRVARHQEERGRDWETVEAPLKLPEAITASSRTADAVVVDCLTLWISNLMMEYAAPERVEAQIPRLTGALESAKCPVVLVSNEVGSGVVPENRLARQFRDLVGFVNQAVAACADRVVWSVAGIAVTIKG